MHLKIGLSLLLAAGVAAQAPKTEVKSVRETLHGVEVVDDYRWLEGSSAPEIDQDPELDARVAAWTDAQNAHTRKVLDNLPGRAALEAKLRPLMEVGSVSAPVMRKDRYFFTRRDGRQAQPVIYMQRGLRGEPRALLDPNTMEKDGLTTISWFEPNHDGTLLAFGMYRAGDENSTLYVLDVDKGDWLADEIPGKVNGVSWMPDASGFFYHRLADVKNAYSKQIRYHRLGTHHRNDPVLFEQYKEGPLATTWGPFAWTDQQAKWLLLGYYTGTDSNDLWVADLDEWRRSGKLDLVEIVKGDRSLSTGSVIGDTLYMRTTMDAPNARVFAVDLKNPARSAWKEIIPERRDAVLDNIATAKGLIVADYLENASTKLEIFDLTGRKLRDLRLPGIGSAGVSTHDDRTEAFVTFTSFNEPNSIYRVDLADGSRELWARPEVPVDPSSVEVKQVWFTSKDGTKVPMFVVHRKGLKLDGSNPTYLYGYGGFNSAETPKFSATLFPWFEAGGVYALPNLRGGSEFGESWHRGGMLEKKQNTFDDFIAAAEWLIANRYTSPKKLAIGGGSNGGLLTGAALVQRPDLFSAVISAVPLLDMLRYQHFLMARYWVPEYGSAENREQFAFIRAYSPYHHVKKGVKYPAVLLTAGENDARVHPLHARKMAAALQAATAGDPKEDPILLWVDRAAGHGQGKPLELRIRDVADQRIFLMWQLGMLSAN